MAFIGIHLISALNKNSAVISDCRVYGVDWSVGSTSNEDALNRTIVVL